MKKKSIFTIFFLFFTIPQSFCAKMQPSEQPQQLRYEDLSLEERQQIDQELLELEHDLQQFDQELPAMEIELQEQSRQVELEMTNLDLTPKGLFHDFQEKVLIQSPTITIRSPYFREKNIRIGLYGKDLLKFAFMILDAYLDSYIKKNLFTLVVTDFTKSLLKHKKKIAELFGKLTYNEDNKPLWDDAYAELTSFITQHGFKPFSYFDDLNFKKTAQTIVNLLISETSFGIQYQFFPPAEQGLFHDIANSRLVQVGQFLGSRDHNEVIISLNTLLEGPLLCFFGISQLASSNAPALRKWISIFGGFNHPFLESYTFYLLKRFLIFTQFMKQNHEFYHQKFCTYFMTHLKEFEPLFIQNSNMNESKQQEALKKFLKEIDTTSFMEWFIYKNKCCNWTNFWLELIITSPALYTFGKSLYNILYPTRGNA